MPIFARISADPQDLDTLLGRIRRGPDGFGGEQLLLLESLVHCSQPDPLWTEEEEVAGLDRMPPVPPTIEDQEHCWGIKWGDCSTSLERRTTWSLAFTFETPWVPPLVGIDAIAQQFPQLRFRLSYREDGNGVRSYATWERSERVVGRSPEIVPGITVERFVLELLASGELVALLDQLRAARALPAPALDD